MSRRVWFAVVLAVVALFVALALWPEVEVQRSPPDGPILRGRFPEEPSFEIPDGGIIIEEVPDAAD